LKRANAIADYAEDRATPATPSSYPILRRQPLYARPPFKTLLPPPPAKSLHPIGIFSNIRTFLPISADEVAYVGQPGMSSLADFLASRLMVIQVHRGVSNTQNSKK
jgi:hypothetical protein